MTDLHDKHMTELGFKLLIPGSAVRRTTDRASAMARPSLQRDISTVANRGSPSFLCSVIVLLNIILTYFQSRIIKRMANSVDPDETARNEPSHQDLHCLKNIWFGLHD